MNEVRPLSTEEEFDAFADLAIDAYPALFDRSQAAHRRLKEELIEVVEQEPAISFWGLFRMIRGEERLLGGMRLFDFQMTFLYSQIPVGAAGQVAVAPEHRRQHVARDLMLFFLRHYRERGTPLVTLYPFRPDFYRNMGFGYGTKKSRYRLDPATLPAHGARHQLRRLGPADRDALRACYARYTRRTHGMIHKIDRELDQLFAHEQRRIVGYEDGGRIRGYIVFTYEPGDTFLICDLHVRELIYETREALAALLAYLHSQGDQIRRVVLPTQDLSFHHLLDDPRNGSDALISPVYHATDIQGVGIMYRVIDVPRIFRLLDGRNFGGQTCLLELRIEDTFLPENAGPTELAFQEGRVSVIEGSPCDIAIDLDVAAFSSLLAGTVSFERLYAYSMAQISDPSYVDTVSRIFAVARQPICTTSF